MKSIIFTILASLLIVGCSKMEEKKITIGVSPDYPPFEYMERGELKGFDIELAKLVAAELGREPVFKDMTFNAVLQSLNTGVIDVGVSAFTASEERSKNYDFSEYYFQDNLSLVYHVKNPIKSKEQMKGKHIATQLGSAMEIWLKDNMSDLEPELFDNNNIAIEALVSGKVEGVLLDSLQAKTFSEKHQDLTYSFIAKSTDGYAIAVKKGSPLLKEINVALEVLKKNGKIAELEKKWLE